MIVMVVVQKIWETDSAMAPYLVLGPVFALFRPVAALLTGLLGGTLVDLLVKEDGQDNSPVPEASCCAVRDMTQPNRWRHAFAHAFVSLPRDIGGAVIVGILIAAPMCGLALDHLAIATGTAEHIQAHHMLPDTHADETACCGGKR